MNTIMITGVGGGVGQSVIKCLQGYDFHLIGADSDPTAAGLHAGIHEGHVVPEARDEDAYIERLLLLCQKRSVSLVFPGHDCELGPLSKHHKRFYAIGTNVVVSRPEVISLCDDKLETARFLEALEAPYPETWPLGSITAWRKPVVLKPQAGGARSKGVFVCRDPQQFARAVNLSDPDNTVVQELIEGPEYTCGTVCLGGEVHGPIIMRRTLRDGDTHKAFVEHYPEIAEMIRYVAYELGPFGACNFQFRVRNGIPYIFEINARCSGTTACRAWAGFNEPLMIANYLLYDAPPKYEINTCLSFLRYWKEVIVKNTRIEQTGSAGEIGFSCETL